MDAWEYGSVGITSTYVENTKADELGIPFAQDHLHIRGEYKSPLAVLIALLGSPPHTWRIRLLHLFHHSRLRITSTYVENTKLRK